MIQPRQCAAIIPCWNEARTIGPLVRQVRTQLPCVLVVDDGSNDRTADLAREAGAEVIHHPHNLGKGAALRTGLTRARTLGFTWGITLDGDGQHTPAAIPAFLDRADRTGAALVAGNRMAQADAMPWLRRATNRWLSRQLSHRAGRELPDSQCGFRLLRLEAWADFLLHTEHFEVESETLLAFVAAGLPVEFVPIPVIPAIRPSRIRPLRDALRWWRWWRTECPPPPRAPSGASIPVTP